MAEKERSLEADLPDFLELLEDVSAWVGALDLSRAGEIPAEALSELRDRLLRALGFLHELFALRGEPPPSPKPGVAFGALGPSLRRTLPQRLAAQLADELNAVPGTRLEDLSEFTALGLFSRISDLLRFVRFVEEQRGAAGRQVSPPPAPAGPGPDLSAYDLRIDEAGERIEAPGVSAWFASDPGPQAKRGAAARGGKAPAKKPVTAQQAERQSKLNRLLGRLWSDRTKYELASMLFGGSDNDIAVSTASMRHIPEGRKLVCDVRAVACGEREFEADFVIVAVPTPVDDAHRPDFSPLVSSSRAVGQNLKSGAIVVYESTVYPGATEEVCIPILEQYSGKKWKTDFFVGYSPERINPGDKERTVTKIVKVVSGDTPETLATVSEIYGTVITAGVFPASSIKVAEAAKVIENTQRDLNIALMNELAIIFDKIGIDTLEVLKAAGTKWNFLPFRPGLVGGHCIGVDPYYLTHKAVALGYHPEVILAVAHPNAAGADIEYPDHAIAHHDGGHHRVLDGALLHPEPRELADVDLRAQDERNPRERHLAGDALPQGHAGVAHRSRLAVPGKGRHHEIAARPVHQHEARLVRLETVETGIDDDLADVGTGGPRADGAAHIQQRDKVVDGASPGAQTRLRRARRPPPVQAHPSHQRLATQRLAEHEGRARVVSPLLDHGHVLGGHALAQEILHFAESPEVHPQLGTHPFVGPVHDGVRRLREGLAVAVEMRSQQRQGREHAQPLGGQALVEPDDDGVDKR